MPTVQKCSLLEQQEESAAIALLQGITDGAVNQPTAGVKQLLGLKPNQEKQTSINTGHSNENAVHKLGSIIGSLVPFTILGLATKSASNMLLGKTLTPKIGRRIGEQALTGFALGAVFTPSEIKPGDCIYASRIKQGFGSALTFGTMTGTAAAIDRYLPIHKGKVIFHEGARRLGIAAFSGAAGGVVEAEYHTGLKADWKELATSASGYAAFGTFMEAGGMYLQAKLRSSTYIERQEKNESRGHSSNSCKPQPTSSKFKTPNDRISEKTNEIRDLLPAENAYSIAHPELAKVNSQSVEKILQESERSKNGSKPSELTTKDLVGAREQILREFKEVNTKSKSGEQINLYESLMDSPDLSDAQKLRLLDVMCHMRNYYAELNQTGTHLSGKAQRSWLHHQAAMLDVFYGAHEMKLLGELPEAKLLEDELLTGLFSQFRRHTNEPYCKISKESLLLEREEGARNMLKQVGYPDAHKERIIARLKDESLVAYPLDRIHCNNKSTASIKPWSPELPIYRDKNLESATPIEKHWKNPTGKKWPAQDNAVESQWRDQHNYGRLQRTTDGRKFVFDESKRSSYAYDESGRISTANHVDKRSFFYGKDGCLEEFHSALNGRYYKSRNDGFWYKEIRGNDKKLEKVKRISEGKIVADDDGTIRILPVEKSGPIKEFTLDGRVIYHTETGGSKLLFAEYNFESKRFQRNIRELLEFDSQRYERIEALTRDFEKQSAERNIDRRKKALFYSELNRLLEESSCAVLRQHERTDLAEQVLNHAAWPTTIDQGRNATCNVTTIENRIYSRSPHAMAGLVADVGHKGYYITRSGSKIDLQHSLTGLKPDAESRICLRLQQHGRNNIKEDGARDWASQIVQSVMAKIKQTDTVRIINRDVVVDLERIVYDKNCKVLGFVGKASDIEGLVDAKGKSIEDLEAGVAAYRKDGPYVQEVAPADLVYNEYGRATGCILDRSKITHLYDSFGNRIEAIEPGVNYFDKDGRLALYESIKGEITYDKVLSKPKVAFQPETARELERLHMIRLGKRIYLKEIEDGKLVSIDSPSMGAVSYRFVCNEITGDETLPFSIMKDTKCKTLHSTMRITNVAELEDAILKLKNDNNLPGILVVTTKKNHPDNNNPFSSRNSHSQGGRHVVNIQGYDPASKLVKITNQWGSYYDLVDPGVHIEEVFKFMPL